MDIQFDGQNKGERPKLTAEEIYQGLRDQALAVTSEELGLEVEPNEPYGILMEIGYPKAVVTLLAMGEGSASMYFSTGGGIIGGGRHERVRFAAQEWVAEAEAYLEHLRQTATFPLPSIGQVRFYVLTTSGVMSYEDSEHHLSTHNSPLAALYATGQAVLTELRLTSENNAG